MKEVPFKVKTKDWELISWRKISKRFPEHVKKKNNLSLFRDREPGGL